MQERRTELHYRQAIVLECLICLSLIAWSCGNALGYFALKHQCHRLESIRMGSQRVSNVVAIL